MLTIDKMYTDISANLSKSWDKDIAKVTGVRAVKNSMIGIITSKKGSKPFEPDFGCDITSQLFENLTPLTADTIEKNIVSAIRQYEPRIVRLKVIVTPLYDSNSVIVDIRFSVLDNPDVLEVLKIHLSD